MKKKHSRGHSPSNGAPRRPAQFGGRRPSSSHSSASTRVVSGTVSSTRGGFGFVRCEEMAESVFLPPREMARLTHGDHVRVRAYQGADQRWSGEVDEVLERGVSAFLATIVMHGRTAVAESADRRLNLSCIVQPADLGGARQGSWVIARVVQYPAGGVSGTARVERLLDPERPVTLATEAAIAKLGLPRDFPSQALADAEAFGTCVDPREAARRVDLRDLPLVTIDGEEARDFDDAVYAEQHGEEFRLLVAIADVSHYVREGSELDAEARRRGTSVYFPQRVLPMLPATLSDGLCSLQPRVDRLCLVADMRVSKAGLLKSAKFYPAVMRSAARLTYGVVFAALFEGRPEARREIGPLVERLAPLLALYRVLHKARQRRGALDFDAPEAKFAISATEQISAIELPLRNDAHRLIEECMVLANVAAARELESRHRASLFRVHDEPDARKLDLLAGNLAALGIGLDLPPEVATRDLQKISTRIKDPAARPFIETLVVRTLMQAVYQPQNIGHFGLALKQYAHFTSPIRRYPDLVVHRTIKAMLDAKDPAGRVYPQAELEVMGQQLSECEKHAGEADRFVETFLKCVYLRDRIGQVFEGLITAVVDFGCFVQLLDVAMDGLLRLEALRDDDYVKDEGLMAWVGQRTGRRLKLGERIRVIVTAVNPVEGHVELDLVTTDIPKPPRTRR